MVVKRTSKQEINLIRLLKQCELMIQNCHSEGNRWRLEKYVIALDDLLNDINRSSCKYDKELVSEYAGRINFLKGLIQTEKLPTAIEKSVATQLTGFKSASKKDKISREIHLKTKAKYTDEMRKELLGIDRSELKQRSTATSTPTSEDLDAILFHHQATQEKVAEDMISLVRNMKANSILANTVVKQDIETVERSTELADRNFGRLKIESENLEMHSSRACHWWIWTALTIVCLTFIATVVFMKLFPKN